MHTCPGGRADFLSISENQRSSASKNYIWGVIIFFSKATGLESNLD